jgi:hypothetical protein
MDSTFTSPKGRSTPQHQQRRGQAVPDIGVIRFDLPSDIDHLPFAAESRRDVHQPPKDTSPAGRLLGPCAIVRCISTPHLLMDGNSRFGW